VNHDERTAAQRIAEGLKIVLASPELPIRIRAWDGSETGPESAAVLVVRSRTALRRLIWAPGELGLARAHIAGEIDIEGDVFATFTALSSAGRLAPDATPAGLPRPREMARLVADATALGAFGPRPTPPPEEYQWPRGRRAQACSAAAISHHYDVGNEFYRLVLGPTMVYSCAVWENPQVGLDAAQEAKLDLVLRKLDVGPGTRLLDVGCGWGSLALRAAQQGAEVVGITLSSEQAALARQRIADAGLAGQVEIRVQDYRDLGDGPFDAISSIGMAEHVGRARLGDYARILHDLLRPGGRLLNHAIAWTGPETTWERDTFIARYVFPDGELPHLAETVTALESSGLEVVDVEALRQHYALTLRAWVERLEKNWDQAVALTSEGRARVWRLYMAGSALGFEAGKMGVNQVLAQRPGGDPPPLRRTAWI
jgi:cyclopropane-fatty-acyl-phospholipid synthase